MASVTALSLNGTAISTLANPDGSYRIDGIPPGDYYIYTQPLPPAQQDENSPAAIDPPSDSHGGTFAASTGFAGQFFPHTRDWKQAATASVNAGLSVADVNFDVEARSGPTVYDMNMLGFFGTAETGAYVHAPSLASGYRGWMVFDAPGTLLPNTTKVRPGLSLSAIGPAGRFEPEYLGYFDNGYLLTVVDANQVSQPTPVALAVTTSDDLFVLPAAFTVVPTAGPTISSVSGSTDALGNASVTLKGNNLGLDTRVLFDGAAASAIQQNDDGSFTVTAPPAIGNHVAVLDALASDGQTSMQTMASLPRPTFTYASPDHPSLSITPATVTAGTDTMIEVDGFNTNFAEGQTLIGFGTSDVVVRRMWIIDRGKALLNISVNPGVIPGVTTVTASTGIQTLTLNAGLQIHPAAAQQISLRAPVLNLSTGLPGVPTGGIASIAATGLPSNLAGWTLTIGDTRVDFTVDSNGRIDAAVPGGTPLGPTVVRLVSPNSDSIAPILFNVDAQPPVIQAAYDQLASGNLGFIDPGHPAASGDVIYVDVLRLYGSAPPVAASSVHISVGGVDQVATALNPILQFGLISDVTRVQFTLPSGLPDGSRQPMTVRVGTRVSGSYTLNVVPPPPASVQPSQRN
jgi:hypothetical protein